MANRGAPTISGLDLWRYASGLQSSSSSRCRRHGGCSARTLFGFPLDLLGLCLNSQSRKELPTSLKQKWSSCEQQALRLANSFLILRVAFSRSHRQPSQNRQAFLHPPLDASIWRFTNRRISMDWEHLTLMIGDHPSGMPVLARRLRHSLAGEASSAPTSDYLEDAITPDITPARLFLTAHADAVSPSRRDYLIQSQTNMSKWSVLTASRQIQTLGCSLSPDRVDSGQSASANWKSARRAAQALVKSRSY